MNNDITIAIATHKQYQYPDDIGYVPLHVGRALSKDIGVTGDDIGDGISEMNPYFCEITGLNWLWKASQSRICGLVHYRRYFKSPDKGIAFGKKRIAASSELSELLNKYNIILPKSRNYVIENTRVHYANAHYGGDIDITEKVIQEMYPQYINSFNRVFSKTSLSLYNMFVMRKSDMDRYCEWLFSILFEVEKRINYKSYDPFQARVFGRISEILLNVWVDHNIDRSTIYYLPVVNIEGENLIKKAYYLLRRKFLNEKMNKSF